MQEKQNSIPSEHIEQEFFSILNRIRNGERITEVEFINFLRLYNNDIFKIMEEKYKIDGENDKQELEEKLIGNLQLYKNLPFNEDLLENLN